jgi:hypothetical protein
MTRIARMRRAPYRAMAYDQDLKERGLPKWHQSINTCSYSKFRSNDYRKRRFEQKEAREAKAEKTQRRTAAGKGQRTLNDPAAGSAKGADKDKYLPEGIAKSRKCESRRGTEYGQSGLAVLIGRGVFLFGR